MPLLTSFSGRFACHRLSGPLWKGKGPAVAKKTPNKVQYDTRLCCSMGNHDLLSMITFNITTRACNCLLGWAGGCIVQETPTKHTRTVSLLVAFCCTMASPFNYSTAFVTEKPQRSVPRESCVDLTAIVLSQSRWSSHSRNMRHPRTIPKEGRVKRLLIM